MAVTRDSDQVSLPAFLAEVRRRVPRGTRQVCGAEERDPFAAMITRICSSRHTMEHRVLARLLRSVIDESTTETSFRITEIAALGPDILFLFSAFIDDYLNDRYDRATIRSALVINGISTMPGTKTTLG